MASGLDGKSGISTGMSRLHDLDALRAVAMLLVVLVHALCFLMSFSDLWPAKHPYADETSPLYNPYAYLFSALAGFLMPLFFILSGYFTAMQWRRRGLAQTVLVRLKRIGLPLLAGLFTVIPITHWIFTQSGIDLAPWPDCLYHLWFLWYLLLVIGCFSAAARLGLRFRHRLWWLLVAAPVVPQYFMRQMLGADVSTVIAPEPAILGYYLAFFLFGVLLYQRRVEVRGRWAMALLPALPVMPLALVFLYPDRVGFVDPEGPRTALAAAVFQVAYTWLACFGVMGLFRRLASRERVWVRYIADASYWIYLAHLPLVIWVQMLAVDWSVDPHLAFALICVAVPGLLLVIYEWGVRYTWVGTLLNGKRVRVRPALSDR